MSNLDLFNFEHSLSLDESKKFVAEDVQWVYLNDNNNNSYSSNQVLFNLDSLSNSGQFNDSTRGFIVMPLTLKVGLTGSGAVSADNDWCASLKAGVQHVLNSIQIEANNNVINNLSPFLNLAITWRLFEQGVDGVNTMGDLLNFIPDSAETVRFWSTASTYGIGECNNAIADDNFTTNGGYGAKNLQNKGRLQRMMNTSFNPTSASFTGITVYTTAAALDANFINHVGLNSATEVDYIIYAVFPLAVIHDFFAKLPITRGMMMKLTLNCNTGCSVNATIAGGLYTACSVTTTSSATLPFMLSPITTGSGTAPSLGVFGNTMITGVTASLNIGAKAGSVGPALTTCRIYVCQVKFTPEYEQLYIQEPIKTINYMDYTNYFISNVGPNAQVNQLLTNGISRLRYLLICPQISSTANGIAGSYFSPVSSPFSSAPTTCAYARLLNFQVVLNGKNVFNNVQNYTYEQYFEQIKPSLSINGGSTHSLQLTSGLINKSALEKGYGWIYVDLSRHASQAEDNVSRSLQVLFTNNNNIAYDYFIIVGFEKTLSINVSSGQFST
jgi:hypothetical protein